MTQQLINVGVSPNDSTGDPIRLAFQKINNNFSELYANVASGVIRLSGNTITTTSGNITIGPTDGQVFIGLDSQLIVSNTAASTSSTTGAFLVSGGVGISGKLYLGDEIHGHDAYFTNIDSTQIGVNIPSIGKFTSLSAATISGPQIGNLGALLTGTLTTTSQPNITSLGTISALTVGDIHMTTGIFWAGNGEAYGNGVLTGYTLPTASNVRLGGVKTGDGLTADGAGVLSLNAASSADIGGIKVGANLTITGAGVLNYSLPTANATILGGVKIGSNLAIDPSTGVLRGATPYATTSIPGVIKVGSGLSIDNTGVLNADALPKANATILGGVRVGNGLIIDGDGILSSTGGYTLPTANATVLGGIKVGTGLTINQSTSVLSANALPIASGTVLGGIRIGAGLTIDPLNGTVSTLASGGNYSLPQATGSVLGGIKVGTGLIIDGSGTLSVSFSSAPSSNANLPVANATVLGGVKIGSGLTVTAEGLLSANAVPLGNYVLPTASSTVLGGIKVGLNLTVDATGTLNAASSNYGNVNVSNFLASYTGTLKAGSIIPSTGAAYTNGIQFPFLSPGDSAWIKYYNITGTDTLGGDNTVLEIGVGNESFGVGQDSITFTTSSGVGINKFNPQAELDVKGDVRISENLYVDKILYSNGNPYLSGGGGSSSIASTTVLGSIKVGDGLRIDSTTGTLSVTGAGAGGYNLPVATTGLLGGVKIGSTLSIDGNGVLNVGNGAKGYTGSSGIQGPPGGYTGSAGFVGSQGYGGPVGYAGSKGDPAGYTGSYGDSGYTGSKGYAGSVGAGYTGSASTVPGYTGSKTPGYTGSQGIAGEYAALGYTGSIGAVGSAGPPGGYTGSVGAGYAGSVGDVGPRGYAGSASTVIGFTGSGFTGSRGYVGYAGSAGDAGPPGPAGPAGSGATYTLPVASAGTLGGIKPGAGISVDPVTGVMSMTGATGGSTGTLNIVGSVISGTTTEGIMIKGFTSADVTISSDSFAQIQWVQNINNTVNHRYSWIYADNKGAHIQINDADCTMWDFNNDGTTRFPEFTFPATHGTRGQVLIDNGTGQLRWGNVADAAAGDFTIATTDILGVVRIGSGLSITADTGILSITNPYSNSNVATYLPTYTGNLQAGNVITLGNGAVYIGTGIFWVGNGAPYIPYGNSQVELHLGNSTAIGNLVANAGIIAGNIGIIQANLKVLAGNIGNLQANTALLVGNIGNLQANTSLLVGNIGNLQANTALLAGNIGNLQANTSVLAGTIGTLVTSSAAQNNSIVYLTDNVSLLWTNAWYQSNVVTTLTSNVSTLFSNAWLQSNTLASLTSNVTNLWSNAGIQADLIASLQGSTYNDGNVANYLLSGSVGTVKAATYIATSAGQFRGYFTGAIGANVANTGSFTTLSVSSWANVGGNLYAGQFVGYHTGAIGANVANSGAFTTLTSSGQTGLANTAVSGLYTTSGIFWANGLAYGSDSIYTNTNVASYLPTHTGNVKAGNVLITTGLLWAGNGNPFSNYSNTDVASYLPTHTGNVKAGNVLITTGLLWAANGNPFSNYGNTNVASYLPTHTGDITAKKVTVDSATGGFYWSNGSLFGSESIYSNTNVSAYLPVYTGNIQAGNLKTTSAIYTTTGIFWAGNNASYISPSGSDTQVLYNNGGSTAGAAYVTYNKTSGNLYSSSPTQSTSSTTGALVLNGGVGVGGNMNVAGYIKANGILYPNGAPYGQDDTLIVALSNEIDTLTAGTGKMTVRIPYDVTLTDIPRAHVTAGSSAGAIVIDVKNNGTTIFGAAGGKLTIPSGTANKTSYPGSTVTLQTTTISNDTEFTFDVTSPGTGVIGLKVTIYFRRNV